jgi:hypothetical protein
MDRNNRVTRIKAETRMTPIRVIRVSAFIRVTLLFNPSIRQSANPSISS